MFILLATCSELLWVPSGKQLRSFYVGLLLWKVWMEGVDLVCVAIIKVERCNICCRCLRARETLCCCSLQSTLCVSPFHTMWLAVDFIHGEKGEKNEHPSKNVTILLMFSVKWKKITSPETYIDVQINRTGRKHLKKPKKGLDTSVFTVWPGGRCGFILL